MTLEKALLQKVPEWRPVPHERASQVVTDPDGPWCARLTADRCEELGAALWEIRLERIGGPLSLSPEQLSDWAKRIVQAPALLEPLAVVEIDQARGNAQIRSATPTERNGCKQYFEFLLSRTGQVGIHRYQAGLNSREESTFVITHETLGRLARQVAEAVDASLATPAKGN